MPLLVTPHPVWLWGFGFTPCSLQMFLNPFPKINIYLVASKIISTRRKQWVSQVMSYVCPPGLFNESKPEDTPMIHLKKKNQTFIAFSEHDRATAFMKSQQPGLPAQDPCEIKPVNIPARVTILGWPPAESYWQMMAARGRIVCFLQGCDLWQIAHSLVTRI